MNRLYCWIGRVLHTVRGHTFVTSHEDFDDPQPDTTKGFYWYCWGRYHRRSIVRPLRTVKADLHVARFLGQPHDPDDTAGIPPPYGRHGTCHQVANRLLYAASGQPAPTVDGAPFYRATKFVYGVYGCQWSDHEQQLWEVRMHQADVLRQYPDLIPWNG